MSKTNISKEPVLVKEIIQALEAKEVEQSDGSFITNKQAIVDALMDKAVSGDLQTIEFIIKLLEKYNKEDIEDIMEKLKNI